MSSTARRADRKRLLLLVPEAITRDGRIGRRRAERSAGHVAAPGGPATFLALLADQLDRRRRWDVPLDVDAEWTIASTASTRLERVHESLLTLADGRLGTREPASTVPPLPTSSAGVYDGEGPSTELARIRDWATLPARRERRPRSRGRSIWTPASFARTAHHGASVLLTRPPGNGRAAGDGDPSTLPRPTPTSWPSRRRAP